MKRKLFLVLIVLGIGLTMLACTTGGQSQRYPYPRYPSPGGQGYPNYPGYPGYPGGYPGGNNNQFEQVRTLANYLKDATAEVVEEATESDLEDVREEVGKLEELDDEAKDFREDLTNRDNSYGYNDPRSGDPRYGDPRYGDPRYGDPRSGGSNRMLGGEKFTELLQKYYAARESMKDLPESEVQQEFSRVTNIMRDLTRMYGYRFDPDQEYLEPTIR